MIFCSSTNVFDASTDSPHFEEDPPNAVSDYGKYKAECESVVTQILQEKLTIVRIQETFSSVIPDKYYNALLTHRPLHQQFQLTHEQLIEYLSRAVV
jgi:dTDP-4-dehydrorhamnose reductase